jgi:hypothetical protein
MTAHKIAYLDNVREGWANLCEDTQFLKRALLATAPALHMDTVVITSANDSIHRKDPSFHSIGLGYDVRYLKHPDGSNRIGCVVATDVEAEAGKWAARLRMYLGRDWQVIVEGNHIHIERDMK